MCRQRLTVVRKRPGLRGLGRVEDKPVVKKQKPKITPDSSNTKLGNEDDLLPTKTGEETL